MEKLFYKIKNFVNKIINFFNNLSSKTLRKINRVAGFHVASFGFLGIVGRVLTAEKIEGFEFLYNWGVTADVGISIVTATLLMVLSFMFYINDIWHRRHEK